MDSAEIIDTIEGGSILNLNSFMNDRKPSFIATAKSNGTMMVLSKKTVDSTQTPNFFHFSHICRIKNKLRGFKFCIGEA